MRVARGSTSLLSSHGRGVYMRRECPWGTHSTHTGATINPQDFRASKGTCDLEDPPCIRAITSTAHLIKTTEKIMGTARQVACHLENIKNPLAVQKTQEIWLRSLEDSMATLSSIVVRRPACQCRRHETQVPSLGQEDSLKEERQLLSR